MGAALVLLFACAIFGNLGGRLLARRKPLWSPRKRTLLAAMPLPSVIWLVCLWVFLNAAISSQESCGVDACGMAMMFSVFGIGYGSIGYVVGLAGAHVAVKLAKVPATDRGDAAIFE